MADSKTRCSWANGELYIEYHDKEWVCRCMMIGICSR
jgi:3-methyladenine DNA glycosylase Tag